MVGWSANLTLPDYGRVARHSEVTGTSHRPTMRSVFSDEDTREPALHERRLIRPIRRPTGRF
jgi:hypothetical protein